MTKEEFSPNVLKLSGYVALEQNGFALPCFASGERPNSWYVAQCSIPRDHNGIVTAFRAFQSDDVVLLPNHVMRQVHVGDPWCDVFLWRGEASVGRPSELWSLLEGDQSAIAVEAPISLLDLAVFSNEPNLASYADRAFAFVRGRFGDARAREWRGNLLFRPMVVRSIQRLIHAEKLSLPMDAARGVYVFDTGDASCGVRLEKDLRKAIAEANLVEDALCELKRLASALSIDVDDGIGGADEEPLLISDEVLEVVTTGQQYDGLDDTQIEAKQKSNILIVLCGEYAERLGGVFRLPHWSPGWRRQQDGHDSVLGSYKLIVTPSWEDDPAEGSVIHIVAYRDMPIDLKRYAVAVFVGRENDLETAFSSHLRKNLPPLDLLNRDLVVLLAPIPAQQHPLGASDIFNPALYSSEFGYDAIVDTGLARSPVRYHTRGSLFRRTAELSVSAALLCSGRSELMQFLKERDSRSALLLTFATGIESGLRDSRPYAVLGSENTWGSGGRNKRAGSVVYESAFDVISDAKRAQTQGFVELREHKVQFHSFAQEVLEVVETSNPRWDPDFIAGASIEKVIPNGVMAELDFRQHVAGFRIESARQKTPIVITGEIPRLSTLVSAHSEGWQVARYTDLDTIREFFLSPNNSYGPPIPLELEVPRLARLHGNQQLFGRGVSKSDLRVVDGEAPFDNREAQHFEFRPLRKYRKPETDEKSQSIWVEPKKQGTVGRISFLNMMSRADANASAAWTRPASGTSRFALLSSVLPVSLLEIYDDEIPHSSMFWIDGTEAAVRGLLQSRLFYVWLRATSDPLIGYRFSLHRSLETFPILPPFSVQRRESNRPYLFLEGDTRMLSTLARELDALPRKIDNHRKRPRVLPYAASSRARRLIDEEILNAYGLDSAASDVEILTSLVRLNERIAMRSAPFP